MTVTTGRAPGSTEQRTEAPNPEASGLHGRYREIGISAVAAALQFAGDAKNPAYAPVEPRLDARDYEAAA